MACHSLLAPAAFLAQDPTVMTRARSLSTYGLLLNSQVLCTHCFLATLTNKILQNSVGGVFY